MKKHRIIALTAVFMSILAIQGQAASALNIYDVQKYRGDGQPTELFSGADAIVPKVINTLLFFVGVLAVIMLIFGGIRYIVSGGDSNKVKDAKNTIIYAIVGLVLSLLAYAIVNWVIGLFSSNGGTGSDNVLVTCATNFLLA